MKNNFQSTPNVLTMVCTPLHIRMHTVLWTLKSLMISWAFIENLVNVVYTFPSKWCQNKTSSIELIHWCLDSPYDAIDLGQHCLRHLLVIWWHQGIAWTTVDLKSIRSFDIYLGAISHQIAQPSTIESSFKVTYRKFHLNLPRWMNQPHKSSPFVVFPCG